MGTAKRRCLGLSSRARFAKSRGGDQLPADLCDRQSAPAEALLADGRPIAASRGRIVGVQCCSRLEGWSRLSLGQPTRAFRNACRVASAWRTVGQHRPPGHYRFGRPVALSSSRQSRRVEISDCLPCDSLSGRPFDLSTRRLVGAMSCSRM